jgi:arsenate reductase
MPNIIIYHNPRCSKSRQALSLLESKGYQPTIILYLQQPPSINQLNQLLVQLNLPARALLRTKEAVYQELGLDNPQLSEQQLLQAICDHPILLERPIVLVNNQAVIARPAEQLVSLLP